MSGLRIAALAAVCLAVLVLIGSMVAGLVGDSPAVSEAPPPEPEARRVRVEVLNAAGVPRLARRGTEHLRDAGFDVVYYGNARGFHPDTTLVLDRVGDAAAAAAVAGALGVERIRAEPDTGLYLEVTVVLGRDWVERGSGEPVDSAAADGKAERGP